MAFDLGSALLDGRADRDIQVDATAPAAPLYRAGCRALGFSRQNTATGSGTRSRSPTRDAQLRAAASGARTRALGTTARPDRRRTVPAAEAGGPGGR